MGSSFPTFRNLRRSLWPWYTTAEQSQALLRLIAVGIEEKVPLTPLIDAWAMDERGVQRGRLLRLASVLGTGMPLDDAIEVVPGVLRDEERLAIRFDAQSGTRTAAMRALLDHAPTPWMARLPGVGKTLLYFAILIPVVAILVSFLHIWIMPVFSKILQEFAVPPPELLIWSRETAGILRVFGLPFALAILVLVWLLLATRAGRWLRHSAIFRVFNPWRDAFAADVLQLLGVAIAAGRPLAGALSTLARYHFDPTIRQRLLFARNEVEQGGEVWRSLTTAGLLTLPEARLLHTAERLGNEPWALGELVQVKRRRTARRGETLSAFVLPVLVIAMGAFVLFHALTVLLPLTELLRVL